MPWLNCSNLFSIISLSALAGLLMISPAAIRLTTTGSSRFIAAGSKFIDSFMFPSRFWVQKTIQIHRALHILDVCVSLDSYWSRQIVSFDINCVVDGRLVWVQVALLLNYLYLSKPYVNQNNCIRTNHMRSKPIDGHFFSVECSDWPSAIFQNLQTFFSCCCWSEWKC